VDKETELNVCPAKTNKKEEVHIIAAIIQWSFDREQISHFSLYVRNLPGG
jgi:hypothetical protein